MRATRPSRCPEAIAPEPPEKTANMDRYARRASAGLPIFDDDLRQQIRQLLARPSRFQRSRALATSA